MKSLRGGRYCGLYTRDLDDAELLAELSVANRYNKRVIQLELARRKKLLVKLAKRLIRRYRGLDIDDADSDAPILADLIRHCHLYAEGEA